MAKQAKGSTKDKAGNQEVIYSLEDLALGASRFGVKYEVVKAALMTAGKKEATIKETEEAIKLFRERKVR